MMLMHANPPAPTQGPAPRLRVLVMEDHAMVRRALVTLLESTPDEFLCVGSASNASDGLAMTNLMQPHRIVLDADLAGVDGVALIPALRNAAPCEVVVVSSHADDLLDSYARRVGAAACLHKIASAETLLAALRAVPANAGDQRSCVSGATEPSSAGCVDKTSVRQ